MTARHHWDHVRGGGVVVVTARHHCDYVRGGGGGGDSTAPL